MELRHLRYFIVVAEEMNIHRAAKRLNISQPPLSVAIKQLEENIGVDLFLREGRGIKITRAGLLFLDKAKHILENVSKATFEAQQIASGKKGKLKIGFISSAVTGILQNSIFQHKLLYPDVVIEMEQCSGNKIYKKVCNNELDLGIERLPAYSTDGLRVRTLYKESWSVAMHQNHPLAKKDKVGIQDLENLSIIFYPRWNNPISYDDVVDIFQQNGVAFNVAQEATEQMTIAGLVASGMGLGIVPECMSKIHVPNVVHRPLMGTKGRTGFALITRKEPDILVEQFATLAQSYR